MNSLPLELRNFICETIYIINLSVLGLHMTWARYMNVQRQPCWDWHLIMPCLILTFSIHLLSSTRALASKPLQVDSVFLEIEKTLDDTIKLAQYIKLIPHTNEELSRQSVSKARQLARSQNNPKWSYRIDWGNGLKLAQHSHPDAIAHYKKMEEQFPSGLNEEYLAEIELKLAELLHKTGQLEQSEHHTIRARVIFESVGVNSGVARADYFLSIIYRLLGRPQEALQVLDSALLLDEHLSVSLKSSIFNNKGRIYRGLGVYDSAHYYYQIGLELVKKVNDQVFIGKFLNNLGNVAHSQGNLSQALEYYLQSLDIKKELNNKRGMAVAFHNVGAVRVDLKSFDEAIIDFQKSKQLSNETNYAILNIHNAQKIGNCHKELGQIQLALEEHEKALKWSEEMSFESGKVTAFVNLAEDHKALKDYKTAIDYLLQAIDLAEKIGKRAHLGFALTSLADAYRLMNKSSSLDGARRFVDLPSIDIERLFKQGAQIAQETENYHGIESSLIALRDFYRESGRYKEEADIADRYIQFRDSLFNRESANAISEWETKYETAEKEKEISILKKDKELQELYSKTQRNRYIWATILLCLLGGLGYTLMHYKLKNRRTRQIDELRNKISSDLHDDVGSILTGLAMQSEILEMTARGEDKKTLHRIHEMARSAMSRTRDAVWAMDSSKDTWIALVDRMKDHAENFITPSPMEYTFKVDEFDAKKILPNVRQHVYLIYKEAITNAIKHSSGDMIEIQLSMTKELFQMNVRDNGKVNEMQTSGIGLTSMNRRAEKIDGEITYASSDGFELVLSVPIQTK